MADVTISSLTALTAAGISDNDDIRFLVDDLQSTPATKQISLTQLTLAITGLTTSVNYSESTVPTTGSAVGIHSVQTGDDRGLYFFTGAEAILLAPYSEDGDWPVS